MHFLSGPVNLCLAQGKYKENQLSLGEMLRTGLWFGFKFCCCYCLLFKEYKQK